MLAQPDPKTSDTPRILVVGGANQDLVLQVDRVPHPGESMQGQGHAFMPGGKGANQAVAAARLGAHVGLVGRLGEDAHGDGLLDGLKEAGIDTQWVQRDSELATGLAVIWVEKGGDNRITFLPGANEAISVAQVESALQEDWHALLLPLEAPDAVVAMAVQQAIHRHIPVIMDAGPPRPIELDKIQGLTVLSPNQGEASALTGLPCETLAHAEHVARVLRQKAACRYVIIKMAEQGAWVHGEDGDIHVPPLTVESVDSTAAGDAFTAALTVMFAKGRSIEEATRFANAAGAFAVTRAGAQPSMPTVDEVQAVSAPTT